MERFEVGTGETGASLPVDVSLPASRERPAERIRSLVDQAIQGDAEAFGGLYDFFIDDVYRYFYHHVGSPHDAEDLASRTFLRAWRGLSTFRWRGRPFEAWLFTLAKNQLVDFYRERRAPSAPLDESYPDRKLGPEGRALANAEAEATRAALAKLTEEQRQVLILKFYLDRENREIALIMGKREGTVRALQMRALQALRRHLSDV